MSKALLMILDGWGKTKNPSVSAISCAKTPFIDGLYNSYSSSELLTHGKYVGLPNGQMGNSEVGHINLGAGRIVYQDLLRINNAIEDGSFFKNSQLLKAIQTATKNKSAIHLMGLVSDGGCLLYTSPSPRDA